MKSSTTSTAAYIKALRRRAGTAARVPEDGPEGWAKSEVDPAGTVTVFDRLRVRSGNVLRAYVFCQGGNGNAVV